MKKILFVLVLLVFSRVSFSQVTEKTLVPVISTTVIDSCIVDSINAKITSAKTVSPHMFGACVKGTKIMGAYIPYGAKVDTLAADSSYIVMSVKSTATAKDTQKVDFGVFKSSMAYASGDQIGFPFTIGQFTEIDKIVIEDDSKQLDSVDVVFFDSTFVPGLDTAAFSPTDADAKHISGLVTIGGVAYRKVLGNNTVITSPFINLPMYFNPRKFIYFQLLAKHASTFTAINNLTVKVYGQ